MKKPNEGAQRALDEAAREVERLLTVVNGVSAELAGAERYLREGNMLGALRANERVARESVPIMKLQLAISNKLGAIMTADPELWAEVTAALAADQREAKQAELRHYIEDWTAEQCREAIEHHLEICDERDCFVVPTLEERIARHEPH